LTAELSTSGDSVVTVGVKQLDEQAEFRHILIKSVESKLGALISIFDVAMFTPTAAGTIVVARPKTRRYWRGEVPAGEKGKYSLLPLPFTQM